jgi:hypothetical protein
MPTADGQPTHALVRLHDYFQKATFIPGAEVLPTDDALLQRLADPKWNPRATVLLAPAGPGAADATTPSTTTTTTTYPPSPAALVTRYTPHQIDLTLTAPAPGYLLINDQYDPDWQVEVNGQPARLLRADYLLRAIPVPAGPATVTLLYVARYRLPGFSLPVIATNDFSDLVMLLAFTIGTILVSRSR